MAENALAQKVVPKLLTQLFRWLLPAKDVPADSKLPDTGLKAVFIYLKAVFIYLKAGFIYCFPWVCLVIRLVSILSEDSDDQYRGEAKLGRAFFLVATVALSFQRKTFAPKYVMGLLLFSLAVDFVLLHSLENIFIDSLRARARILPGTPLEIITPQFNKQTPILAVPYATAALSTESRADLLLKVNATLAKLAAVVAQHASVAGDLFATRFTVDISSHCPRKTDPFGPRDACGFPTGQIFLAVETARLPPAQLAFVLSHEIAHIMLYHGAEREFVSLFIGDTLTDLTCFVTGAMCTSDVPGERCLKNPGCKYVAAVYEQLRSGGKTAWLTKGWSDLLRSKVSVRTELEADLYGLYLASLAGFCKPPSECLDYFGKQGRVVAGTEKDLVEADAAAKRGRGLLTALKKLPFFFSPRIMRFFIVSETISEVETHPPDADRRSALEANCLPQCTQEDVAKCCKAELKLIEQTPGGQVVLEVSTLDLKPFFPSLSASSEEDHLSARPAPHAAR